MPDITTVEYREYTNEPKTQRGFPLYRVLFGIQLAAMATVYAAAKGWI